MLLLMATSTAMANEALSLLLPPTLSVSAPEMVAVFVTIFDGAAPLLTVPLICKVLESPALSVPIVQVVPL